MGNPGYQRGETAEQAQARQAIERANAAERELAAFRQLETERRQTVEPITQQLPQVQLERLGAQEEQAARARIARDLMAEQQAGQRQLMQQQARQGVRGGAASAQQARLAQQIAQQRAAQEEAGFLGQRQFNIQQAQREQFANVASELAKRQLMAALRGQDVQARAAERYGQQQAAAASGGKVICTELYAQHLMPMEIFEADQKFGQHMQKVRPVVMRGYWLLAKPIVRLMGKSKVFTRLVWFVAKPWANEMAYRVGTLREGNRIGAWIMSAGIWLCERVGKMGCDDGRK